MLLGGEGEMEDEGGGGIDIYKGRKETRRSLQRILSVNVGVCRSETESVISLIVKTQSMFSFFFLFFIMFKDALTD